MARKSLAQKYGPRLSAKSPTLLALIKQAIVKKYLVEAAEEELPITFRSPAISTVQEFPLQYIALVYDGKVREMIRVNEPTAKFLLGGAELVPYNPEVTEVTPGMIYTGTEFVAEEPEA